MPNNELFAEFPPITKSDWLNQISKDLKNNTLESFEWAIEDDLHMSPFVQAADFNTPPVPLWNASKAWEISETVEVEDVAAANARALEALNGGAEGLQFEFVSAPEWAQMEQLLSGIHPDFIGLHFSGRGVSQNPSTIFSHILRLAKTRGINPALLHGSVTYDPVRAGNVVVDWRYLADLLEFTQESLPHFKVITIDFSLNENPASALGETLQNGHEYLKKLSERGIPPEKAAAAIQFSVPVGKSYFLEIAKIRALKLLWINVLKGWGAPLVYPAVAAYFRPEAYTDELYTNMIRATTMAMSAVMGGADRLTVRAYDAAREAQATYPPSFGRRIARNVQHLLKMESHLETIGDPVAGSYYIEKLTEMLANKAWERW